MSAKPGRVRNRILQVIQRSTPYARELRPYVGSVTATLLMQQMDYWFYDHPDGYYKFLQPCEHALYRPGQSWTEEMGFSLTEVRGALAQICTSYKSRTEYDQAEDAFQGKYYCAVYNRVDHLTYYYRNHDLIDAMLDHLTSGADPAQFPEIRKPYFPKQENPTPGNKETLFREEGKPYFDSLSESTHESTPEKGTRGLTSTPVDVPRSFPNDTKGPTWAPSKDGQPPLEWERLLIEHCYGGVGLPEWGQQRRSVGFLRTNYPLKVVLAYFDERMRTMKGERRTLTPKLLATDIVSWAGLDKAIKEWEYGNGGTAEYGGSADGDGPDAGAANRGSAVIDERVRRAADWLNSPRFVRPVQGRHVVAATGD